MTQAQRLARAATLLAEAATVLDGHSLAVNVDHLARAARLYAVTLDATVVVDVVAMVAIRYTVRQEDDRVILIDRATGEKRHTSLLAFVGHGTADAAWEAIGGAV